MQLSVKQIDFFSFFSNYLLTLLSKSSKLAKDDEPNDGPWEGRGGVGLGGGCFAFLGGKAGDGDSGALLGLDPWGGAWSIANGSLPKASFPI